MFVVINVASCLSQSSLIESFALDETSPRDFNLPSSLSRVFLVLQYGVLGLLHCSDVIVCKYFLINCTVGLLTRRLP